MPSIADNPLFTRLEGRTVLVAGAGGGFDVYAGLPLALALRARGQTVHLANASFTYLAGTSAPFVAPHLAEVTPDAQGQDGYFPERTLARWLAGRGQPSTVYAFEKVGVAPLTAAYRALQARLGFDAVVLVDGGSDILMFGDEAGLGTPSEDMASLAAAHALDVPVKAVACIGFGVDAFHGVCHAHFLENVAALERDGAYLGAFSVSRHTDEGAAFLDAVADAARATPARPSIVNGSIAAAVRGEFGDVALSERTRGSELFINPLMSLYFAFDLDGLARRSLYLSELAWTESIFHVASTIEAFRNTVPSRPWRPIPH